MIGTGFIDIDASDLAVLLGIPYAIERIFATHHAGRGESVRLLVRGQGLPTVAPGAEAPILEAATLDLADRARQPRQAATSSAPTQDEYANNCVATGAVWAILSQLAGTPSAIERADIDPADEANQVRVELSFLNSPYRLTVERIDEPKQGARS